MREAGISKSKLTKQLGGNEKEVRPRSSRASPKAIGLLGQRLVIGLAEEKAVRRQFAKFGTQPKILIVTEKLLTGYERAADEASDDPFLVGLAERAQAIGEQFEDRQTEMQKALTDLIRLLEENESR